MAILVTGANGQLGNEMRLLSHLIQDRWIFADVVEQEGVETLLLDVTDADAVEKAVAENDVKIVVNCAAYTNVDKAEDETELCSLLNAEAPSALALTMSKIGGFIIQISTDYVFGAVKSDKPYTEDHEGAPLGVYGATKLSGEQAVIASGADYVIIRTSWLYSEYGKNFVKTIRDLLSKQPKITVVNDQIGTPTYALDLAKTVCTVIKDYKEEKVSVGGSYSKNGIYNFSNEGICSWYEFACVIAEISGNTSCQVSPCLSAEYPSKVTRPAYSVLDKTKIKQAFGVSVPSWMDSLKACIQNL